MCAREVSGCVDHVPDRLRALLIAESSRGPAFKK